MQTADTFVVVRIKASTRQRLKVKAAKNRKPLYEVIDELSK